MLCPIFPVRDRGGSINWSMCVMKSNIPKLYTFEFILGNNILNMYDKVFVSRLFLF